MKSSGKKKNEKLKVVSLAGRIPFYLNLQVPPILIEMQDTWGLKNLMVLKKTYVNHIKI